MTGYLPVCLEIALVTDQDHRKRVAILDTTDLLIESGDFLKRQTRCDGVDKDETFTVAHVLLSHGTIKQDSDEYVIELVIAILSRIITTQLPVFFLSCSVEDV